MALRTRRAAGGCPRILHAVTASGTTRLMLGQLRHLREAGFEVFLTASPGEGIEEVAAAEGVVSAPVAMEREMSPLHDLKAFWRAYRLLRRLRPTLVNYGTAKAGLLFGVAAWLARVPCRVYTLHGLRLETTRGLKRRLLTLTERTACRSARRVLCVSESVRELAVSLRLCDEKRTAVLGAGSFNGVEEARFAPTPERFAQARRLRKELGIPPGAPVIGFVGRFTRDKGIPELAGAYQSLRRRFPDLRLLLLGSFEAGDPVPEETRRFLESDPGVVQTGFVRDPAPYYQVMDVLALPTYREGFPTVVLEASATAKPVVATTATGARDAVVDGLTGLLAPIGDVEALASCLGQMLENPEKADEMGMAGRERVLRQFNPTHLRRKLSDFYWGLIGERGLAPVETPSGSDGEAPRRRAVARRPRPQEEDMNFRLGEYLLRRPEPGDIEALYQQKNDPELSELLLGFPAGYSRADIGRWIEYHSQRQDEAIWVAAEAESDRCVGHCGFYQIDHRVGSAQVGLLLGDRSVWGKGLGSACLGFLVGYAFDQLNLNRVEARIVETNARARRLYRGAGFKPEGRLRQAYYRAGEYRDVLVFGLLRSDRPAAPEAERRGRATRGRKKEDG